MKKNNSSGRKSTPDRKYFFIAAAALVLGVILAVVWLSTQNKPPELLSLNQVVAAIESDRVASIEDTMITGEIIVHYKDGSTEKGIRDTSSSLLEQLSLLGLDGKQLAQVRIDVVKNKALTVSKVASTGLTLALVGVLAFMALRMVRNGPMSKKEFSEGNIPETTFADVAGMDESLQELRDIVTFLKEGEKFAEVGAKMPRGVLLVGDPGTGKTLIARAVAGEAGVPFFAISGSEFVEVFVGVGASRVRSLFAKARKKAPCIIFIDEIDAVGRERHSGGSGAEAEQDQTLNQLLVEMDGFSNDAGIMVLAATNRADVLDSALLRPGRFDRRVFVGRPDVKGREEILKVHIAGKQLAQDVKLSNVAKATPGLVGADLANIINEAAILAVRAGRQQIGMRDFEEAIEKNYAGGVQRKSQVMSEDERRIIAFHEAGHAMVIHATRLADPVYKITIIPRGQTGGYTMALPERDSLLMSKNRILARITGLMGGRAAEEIFFQDITSGASGDLQSATQLAEEMVMRLGMDSSTGLRVFQQPQGIAALAGPHSSQKTFETIDEAVRNILNECYDEARRILREQRTLVERIANELLEVETLNQERFLELVEAQPEAQPAY